MRVRVKCPKCGKYSSNKKNICHNCSYYFIIPGFFEYRVLSKAFKKVLHYIWELLLFIMLFLLFLFMIEYCKVKDYVKTEGVFVECDYLRSKGSCRGIYEYSVDENVYYTYSKASHYHPDIATVYYNPEKYDEAEVIDWYYNIPYVFIIISIIYLFTVIEINTERKGTSL